MENSVGRSRCPMRRGKHPARRTKVYSIGHSTRTFQASIAISNIHGISKVVDVRKVPRSGHNPQFNKDVLAQSLKVSKIGYMHMPKLGGLCRVVPDSINKGWLNPSFRGYADYMQTDEFQSALEKLIDLVSKLAKIVLMCAESVRCRCHRSLIADALLARKIQVIDILSATLSKEHVLPPWAEVKGKRITHSGSASKRSGVP